MPLGDLARWRVLYALLRDVAVDETLTYETMADALGLDAAEDRNTLQVAMRRAARELEEKQGRAVDAEPNVGYRVVQVVEHLGLAKRQQKRSLNALRSGQSKVTNVDLSNIAPDVRKAFEVVAMAFALQVDFNRRTDVRQKRLEQSLAAMSRKSVLTDDEIRDVKERLVRLEGLS